MDAKYFEEVKAREQKAMPGPWHWEVATANKSVCLENGRDKVMDFARYGMDGAAPRFNVNGIMERADKLAKSIPGMEHHRGFDDYINHPDADFIAHARTDIPALIAEVERLTAEKGVLKSECKAHVRKQADLFKGYQEMKARLDRLVEADFKVGAENAMLKKALEMAVAKIGSCNNCDQNCNFCALKEPGYFIQQAQEAEK